MTHLKKMLLLLGFVASVFAFGETAEQKELVAEYDALLNRVRYATKCGFCFDGRSFVGEVKNKGGEQSFFIEEKNVYLKVKSKKNGATSFTRCFDLTEQNGVLAVNAEYVLTQKIPLASHWNFFKMGKKLNITVCDDNTCKNTELELYVIQGEPLTVTDGIFLTFAQGAEKKAETYTVSINAKGLPEINLADEKKFAETLLKKMQAVFPESQFSKMKAELNAAFKKAGK